MFEKLSMSGAARPTVKFAGADTAALLSSKATIEWSRTGSGAALSETEIAKGAWLTVETNGIRIAFGGAVPTSGADGLGHLLTTGDSLFIDSRAMLKTCQIINSTAGSNALVQVTLFY